MIRITERFIPIQINQEHCMKCERCLTACRQDAIYFKNSIRLVDYKKCKACLACVQVCPRNAIEVTSVINEQVLTVKIEHDNCTVCLKCTDNNGEFCPNNLFSEETVKKDGELHKRIKFDFSEIEKCQGCLRCELSCPENAIKPVTFKT